MSFLYPLFLLAGTALAIPVLIHLFNLRKYKTVYFPHTRFLKDIQLSSRKQSQIKYKWLLICRLLFLASLVLAFAQPFFNNTGSGKEDNKLKIIYIDNSFSMLARKGARSMLDIAKDAARRQVQQAAPGTRFVLLTNDRQASYHAAPAGQVYKEIIATDVSAGAKNVSQVLAGAQSILQNEAATAADLYYYSDFQRAVLAEKPARELMQHLTIYGIPVQATDAQNLYIDSAWLTSPVLQVGKSNAVVVHTRLAGATPKESPVLNLMINGQVKSAASLNFSAGKESFDTLSFQVNDASWQSITLALNDAALRYDDTFRIAARSAPNLSVLVLNEGQLNPYVQAAFRAYNGFRINQADLSTPAQAWHDYNLVILNGITRMDEALGHTINDALQQGQTVCIFPGRTANVQALNDGLKMAGDIRISGIDTAVQAASSLQQGSALVRDLFERIPDNVQLPVANWHYMISAGLGANQQSILSFRNGDPFLARYTPSRGQLYICATAADLQSGNFPGSYFFTPFLYQMAMQSGGSSVYAITAGSRQAVYLPLGNAAERNTVHLYGASATDIIPPQRSNGAGLDVFVDESVRQPGFYTLAAPGMDSARIALNQGKGESLLEYITPAALRDQWKGDNVKWMDIAEGGNIKAAATMANFPLWKVCVILALVMLAAESFLLIRPRTVSAGTAINQ